MRCTSLRYSFLWLGLLLLSCVVQSAGASEAGGAVVWVTQTGSGDLSGSDEANAAAWGVVRSQIQSETTYRFSGDIYGGMPQAAQGLQGVIFDGSSQDGKPARFRNDIALDASQLVEEPEGIFSFELDHNPPSLVWEYRQDDISGSVTGIDFLDAEVQAAFEGTPAGVQARFGAWYGHLHPVESAAHDLTPGQWTRIGNRVYVRPPEPADVVEVEQKLRRIGRTRGVYFFGCTDIEVRHLDFIGFGNPGGQTGAVYTSGCRGIRLVDLIAYDSGYRAFNLEGSTGDTLPLDIVAENCVAAGDLIVTGSHSNAPIVVYNDRGCVDCAAMFVGGGIAAYPWLDFLGRPLAGDPLGIDTPMALAYRPVGFYTHHGLAGIGMGGLSFEEFFVVSFCQQLNERHGLAMVWEGEGIGRIIRSQLASPVDGTDPTSYPIRFTNSVFVCNPGLVQYIVFDRCRFITPRPRGALQSYAGRIQAWFQAPQSLISLYFISCELVLQQLDAPQGNGLFNLTSGNTLCMDLCTVYEVTDRAQFRSDSLIRTVDGVTLRLRGCLFGTSRADGANQHFLYRPQGPVVQIDYDPVAWAGIDIESCWFFHFSPNLFNERYGTSSAAGGTYPQFVLANTAGGASEDYVTGEHVFGVDPLLQAGEAGYLAPLPESPLRTERHQLIPELATVLDFNGHPYEGVYGAVQRIGEPCPGDATGDGVVDIADLNTVLANFGSTSAAGDLNGDGTVDLGDLNIVLTTFGIVCNS